MLGTELCLPNSYTEALITNETVFVDYAFSK